MSGVIQAEYDQLDVIMHDFEKQAQVLEELLKAVMSRFEALENGGWIGRGSKAFVAEMRGEVLPVTNRLLEALLEGQQVTREISQVMQQAEQDASSRFR